MFGRRRRGAVPSITDIYILWANPLTTGVILCFVHIGFTHFTHFTLHHSRSKTKGNIQRNKQLDKVCLKLYELFAYLLNLCIRKELVIAVAAATVCVWLVMAGAAATVCVWLVTAGAAATVCVWLVTRV